MDKKNGPQKSYHQLGWLNWVCKDSYKLQRKHPRLDGVTEKQIPGKSRVHPPPAPNHITNVWVKMSWNTSVLIVHYRNQKARKSREKTALQIYAMAKGKGTILNIKMTVTNEC